MSNQERSVKTFVWDTKPYCFESEYNDEELQQMEEDTQKNSRGNGPCQSKEQMWTKMMKYGK